MSKYSLNKPPMHSLECETYLSKSGKPLRKELLIPLESSPRGDLQALILELMLQKTQATKDNLSGYYINISSRGLKELIGSTYAQEIKELAASESKPGDLEVNGNHYQVDEFSKSYRLAKRLRPGEVRKYRLERARDVEHRFEFGKADRIGRQLAERLTHVQLSGNFDGLSSWDRYRFAQIQAGQLYASRCKYDRFHSTFTCLSREGRSLLRSENGKAFCEVDVVNCQPLLAWSVLSQMTPQDGSSMESRYRELCEGGEIYEFLMNKMARFGQTRTRDAIKTLFFRLFFQRPDRMERNPLMPVVSREFPVLYKRLGLAKADRYKELARNCQRLEASIMLDSVCNNLLELSPQLPLITIHDCLMVEPEYVDLAEHEIKKQFALRGIRVSIKVKDHNVSPLPSAGEIPSPVPP